MELKIEHIYQSYKKKEVLKDICFTLQQGVYGLLGENGAGKSTLMRLLATVNIPKSGRILYDGEDIFTLQEAYRGIVGYMPQDYSVYPSFTAQDFLEYMGALKGLSKEKLKTKIPEVLELVNLSEVAKKKVKTFSGGMKRRLGIAQAILNEPQIIILDEPTAGLDPRERVRFSNIISDMAKDKIVLLSTHIVSDIEAISNDLIIIKNGGVFETGNIEQLVKCVTGKVWEAIVEQKVYQQLREEREIIRLKQLQEMVQVRFIGERYDGIESRQVEPTLEDYYIFVSGMREDEEK